MPCESVQQSTVEWSKNTDHNSVEAALKALGLAPTQNATHLFFAGGTYDKRSNRLTLTGSNAEAREKEMKRSYVTEMTKAQARKFGFQVVQGKNKYEFNLVKRSI